MKPQPTTPITNEQLLNRVSLAPQGLPMHTNLLLILQGTWPPVCRFRRGGKTVFR